MPFGDGTGPMGMGPMDGKGMGYCAGSSTQDNPNCGRGWFNRGARKACRHGHHAHAFGVGITKVSPASTPEAESAMLRNQAKFLKQRLEEIQNRIGDLENSKTQ